MANNVKITIQAIDKASATLGKISKQMGAIAAIGLGGSFGIAKEWTKFETAITNAGVMAGATAQELEKMGQAARKSALDTAITAVEAAEGMYYVASAGIDVTKDMNLYNASMNLAVGTTSNMSDAVQLVNSVLSQFNLSLTDSGKVADTLAYAISGSQANMGKLSASMRQAGAIAGAVGQDFNDVAASLMQMYNNGLQGEQAGTALRSVFSRLLNVTGEAKRAFDELGISLEAVDPSQVGIIQIVQEFEKAAPSMSQLVQIFGQEAVAAFQILMNAGGQTLKELSDGAEEAAGRASEMADAFNKTDATKIQNMIDSLKDLAYDVGPAIVEAFEEMFEPIRNTMEAMKEMGIAADATKATVKTMGGMLVASLAGNAVSGAVTLAKVIGKIGAAFGTAGVAAAGAGAAVLSLGTAAAALTGLNIKLFSDAKRIKETALATGELTQKMTALSAVRIELPQLNTYMEDLAKAVSSASDMTTAEALDFVVSGKVSPDFLVEFDKENQVSEEVKGAYDSFVKNIQSKFNVADNEAMAILASFDADPKGFITALSQIVESTGAAYSGLKKVSDQAQQTVDDQGEAAKQTAEQTRSAINKIWDAAGSPLEKVKEELTGDLADIQQLLAAVDMSNLGDELTSMITDGLKTDLAEAELKKKIESITETIFQATGKIPEQFNQIGENLDASWWKDYVDEINGTNIDLSKSVNSVQESSRKMKIELNDLQGLTRRNMTTPEIRVVGSNITKHRVEVILDLNKDEFLKQWNKLGFNMTANLENSLLYG